MMFQNDITDCVPVEELQAKVAAYLREHEGFDRGTRFYSREEWQARGEEVAADAPLTLLIEESALSHILNWCEDAELIGQTEEELSNLLEPLGYYYELGYTWTMHFYPIS